jgi:hypothetical protein
LCYTITVSVLLWEHFDWPNEFFEMLWMVKSGNIVGGAFHTVRKMDYAPALRAIELPEMIFCIGVMV